MKHHKQSVFTSQYLLVQNTLVELDQILIINLSKFLCYISHLSYTFPTLKSNIFPLKDKVINFLFELEINGFCTKTIFMPKKRCFENMTFSNVTA